MQYARVRYIHILYIGIRVYITTYVHIHFSVIVITLTTKPTMTYMCIMKIIILLHSCIFRDAYIYIYYIALSAIF